MFGRSKTDCSAPAALVDGCTVKVPRRSTVAFPRICPICLQPATKKLQLRVPHLGGGMITRVSFPVCRECYRRIAPIHVLRCMVLGWGLVAAAFAVAGTLRDTLGIVLFFVLLLASRFVRDYNPTGVSFSTDGRSMVWSFPSPEYARLFYEANRKP